MKATVTVKNQADQNTSTKPIGMENRKTTIMWFSIISNNQCDSGRCNEQKTSNHNACGSGFDPNLESCDCFLRSIDNDNTVRYFL